VVTSAPILTTPLVPADTSGRDAALDAVAAAAAHDSLTLARGAPDRLVDAMLGAVEHRLLLRGFQLAYAGVEREIADTYRYLIQPARQRAQAGQDKAGTLHDHLRYAEGMTAIRDALNATLRHLAERTPGSSQDSRDAGQPISILAETT
jgi:hypothetical protein